MNKNNNFGKKEGHKFRISLQLPLKKIVMNN